jgi:hypothetical protein
MANLTIQEVDDGVIFTAKVVPGSNRTAVCGLLDEILKIKVSAAPERGKANQCLLKFLAKQLGVKKNAVSIISGKTKPIKCMQVLGISPETLLKKLNLNKRGSG